jgi:type IV secretion system protein VirB10
MPNGRSIVLERQPGADAGGYAGLQDEVDNRWLELFKAAALSTLLSVGTELGSSGNDSDIIQALRRGAGNPSVIPVNKWFGAISISSQRSPSERVSPSV